LLAVGGQTFKTGLRGPCQLKNGDSRRENRKKGDGLRAFYKGGCPQVRLLYPKGPLPVRMSMRIPAPPKSLFLYKHGKPGNFHLHSKH